MANGDKSEVISFYSILDMKGSACKDKVRPAFFVDLNLNQVIDRICRNWEADIASFYYYFPSGIACEDYRREVFADVKRAGCSEVLENFLEGVKGREEALTKKKEVHLEIQKAVWHIREVVYYCSAFVQLSEGLGKLPLQSGGMLAFRSFLQQYLASEDFAQMQARAEGLWEELSAFCLVLTYENDRILVALGEIEGAYEKFLNGCFPGHGRTMKSPFGASSDLLELEQEIIRLLWKQRPGFFREAEKFYKEYGNYALDTLLRFSVEIQYYLSFYCFEQKMTEEGFVFAEPLTEQGVGAEMSVEGLYDLALACACGGQKEVVSNEVNYRTGEKFFVLTGPNQGGKTTFARSLGQLVYFSKMGLDVPARSARIPQFSDILTHFSVEESVETGRGKLKEELVRLAPMMDTVRTSRAPVFVIINELFTTAANYDACIMGKRVLEHFLAHGCQGIYVTHLKELAEAHPGIVSLRAMLDKQGRQTFQIARGEAADSASAANQVKKHRLTYGELKERLS